MESPQKTIQLEVDADPESTVHEIASALAQLVLRANDAVRAEHGEDAHCYVTTRVVATLEILPSAPHDERALTVAREGGFFAGPAYGSPTEIHAAIANAAHIFPTLGGQVIGAESIAESIIRSRCHCEF
jgi:hypothetical protein